MQDGWLSFKAVIGIGVLLLVFGCSSLGKVPESGSTALADEAPAPNSFYYYTEAQILKHRGENLAALEMMQRALESDPQALYVRRELATLYLQNKNEERAVELLQGILADAPGDVPTLLLLGRIHQSRKDLEQAKAAYEAVLDQDPDQEDVYLLLGNLYMNDGQWDEAFDVFDRLTTRFPGAYAGFFFLGRIHLERGDDDKAEAAFLRSLAIEPKLEGARYELIQIYEGRPDSAETRRNIRRQYQAVLDEDPGNVRATFGLATYYHRIGQDRQARDLIAIISTGASENDLIATVFKDYLEPGQNLEAVFLLQEILRNRSDLGSLHYLLGLAYSDMEDTRRAMTHFAAVPPESRFYRDAVIQQAYHHGESEQVDAAIALLQDALSHDPDHPDFLIYLAGMYEEKEEFRDALTLLERAIAVDPDNERAYFRLGVVYDKLDLKDESIAAMQRTIAINPDHANALNYLGYTYADLGINLDEAEKLIQKALEIKPDDGYITDSLGWVYYKQGRYQEALKHLLRAAGLVGDDPIILEHVGDAYQGLGRRQEALEYYRRSLSIREEDRDALIQKIDALEKP